MADAGTAPGTQQGAKSTSKGPLALLMLLGVLLVFSFITTSAVLQMLFSSDRASAAAQRQELDSLLSGTAAKTLEQRMATTSTQQLSSTEIAVPDGHIAREAPRKGSEMELATNRQEKEQPRKDSGDPDGVHGEGHDHEEQEEEEEPRVEEEDHEEQQGGDHEEGRTAILTAQIMQCKGVKKQSSQRRYSLGAGEAVSVTFVFTSAVEGAGRAPQERGKTHQRQPGAPRLGRPWQRVDTAPMDCSI